jgi:asparagine N-glycosylation enzyme membrane subunit Stt3
MAMPALTIYLSRLIGVVFLIVAVAMLADKEMGVAALGQLGVDRTPLLLLGLVRVVFGVVIVLVHNVWRRGFWPLVVTLTGWAILVRGVMVLFIPPEAMAGIMDAAHVVDFYYVYAAIPLVLGFYLALRGFSVSAPPIGAPSATAKPSAAKPQPAKTPPRRRR